MQMRGVSMADIGAEPSMEDILSSIKRIIAEENDSAPSRAKRSARPLPPRSEPAAIRDEEILELSNPAPEPQPGQQPGPVGFTPAKGAPVAAGSLPDSLVSPRTAEASRGPLDTLSRMVVSPEVNTGDESFEGVVREMLRPMLRDWLDTHLPEIVEAMVAREIERITRK